MAVELAASLGEEVMADHKPLQDMLGKLGMNGPPLTWDGLSTVIREAYSIPLLTFAEAEQIGAELHDRWQSMAGAVPLARDDLAWGDIVQFICRRARDLPREPEPGR